MRTAYSSSVCSPFRAMLPLVLEGASRPSPAAKARDDPGSRSVVASPSAYCPAIHASTPFVTSRVDSSLPGCEVATSTQPPPFLLNWSLYADVSGLAAVSSTSNRMRNVRSASILIGLLSSGACQPESMLRPAESSRIRKWAWSSAGAAALTATSTVPTISLSNLTPKGRSAEAGF